jgi:hypothetical protein
MDLEREYHHKLQPLIALLLMETFLSLSATVSMRLSQPTKTASRKLTSTVQPTLLISSLLPTIDVKLPKSQHTTSLTKFS